MLLARQGFCYLLYNAIQASYKGSLASKLALSAAVQNLTVASRPKNIAHLSGLHVSPNL